AFVSFGISDVGEIMPFQSPLGFEHLAWGTFLSGYTLAYEVGGVDHIAFAVFTTRNNIVPFSYRELENSPTRTIVEVVARTAGRGLFTFVKNRKYVTVQSHVENLSGLPASRVVFKEDADWDVDGNFGDTWDYDVPRHLVYATSTHTAGIASEQTPAVMDIYGWNDYNVRATTVEFPVGPVLGFDGLEVLHFELGTLNLGQASDVTVAYGAGNSVAELQSIMDEAVGSPSWLRFEPATGVVPAGGSPAGEPRIYTREPHVGALPA